ncbi:XkdF-like putative serine protease domain-containing protein [Halorubrum virus BJ1]|uniref:Phage-like element PBSX protein XkdF domain-containing protein n=1 Tax=Halorubrum virus BJ1 TaxID=416419 RepID=A0ZYR5_9CAUD|nr:XkdF-like putative serine protease domain-containing protein [Halorubrum virus BJ1]CAL92474.1 hypothetical protein [Halorubrum virus BJ1]
MPSVKQAGGTAFRKEVEFVTKDDEDDEDDEQVAAGIVMVPDKADLQNDYVREETLRSFADQFATFYEAGQAGGGVMHAVFPDDWMDLERNGVLDESEEIGGETVDAGAWVQEWAIKDDGLWGLIQDDIISGYSIGAVQVDWNGPYEQDELDDVEVPDEIGDELVYELIDGIIREVSAVDIPAVPDAQILEASAKSGAAEKRLGDYLGDPDGFIEEALARGHSEDDAERLWEHLNRAIEVEGSNEPGTKSRVTEAAKTLVDLLTLSGEEGGRSKARGDGVERDADADGVDDADGQGDKDAAGGDTPADDGGSKSADDTTMSNDNGDDGSGDGGVPDKTLAEENAEQIKELTETIETLTAALKGEEPTVEIELDGETHEVPKSQAKSALGIEDGGADDGVQDEIKELRERLDSISRQSGVGSDQLSGGAGGDGEGGKESGLDDLGAALS